MVVAVPSVVSGHHASAAEFGDEQIPMKGVITKIQYVNPHTTIFIDVTNKDGTVTSWELEFLPPANLFRLGWRKDLVKVGTTLSGMAFVAKDGVHRAHLRQILANGEKLLPLLAGGGAPSPAAK